MRRPAGWWAPLLWALTVAGCGVLPGSSPVVRLDNLTNSPATVDVNGTWVGTYAAGTSADVPLAGSGKAPFIVTVRTPSGLIAAQLEVAAADVEVGAEAAGNMQAQAELPCGTIRLTFGQPAEPAPAVVVAGSSACP